jgi:hypothetical protein
MTRRMIALYRIVGIYQRLLLRRRPQRCATAACENVRVMRRGRGLLVAQVC